MLTELCCRAQSGDSEAYAQMLAETESIVRVYLLRRISDGPDIDDIVQETLISIHRGLHTYIPGRSFTSWMFAIAHNRMCDFFRRQKRLRCEVGMENHRLDDFSDESRDSGEEVANVDRLYANLSSIPTRYADAVRMTKLEGNSVRKASRTLGISEGALRVAVHRAYKLLRSRINEDS